MTYSNEAHFAYNFYFKKRFDEVTRKIRHVALPVPGNCLLFEELSNLHHFKIYLLSIAAPNCNFL